jgi:membrane dipeptidase
VAGKVTGRGPHDSTRRAFLSRALAASAAAAIAWPSRTLAQKPAIPYVDGLTFLGPDPADIERSGLAALILDVSSVAQVKTDDGSIRYFRSFEACAQSMTAMRRALGAGMVGRAFLASRGSDIDEAFRTGRTAVFFQMQGAEPIGEGLWRLELFHELGLRVQQITHHNDNAWGGGAIEKNWTGLTTVGRDGVERLNALGVIPDISHASDLTARDVLAASRTPVILSHGAARAFVNNARCAPDDVIRGVGRSGGVMGIFMMSMWLTTDPTPTTDAYVRQLRHVIDIAGIDAAGVANDYPLTGEAAAVKAGNDNAKVIENYYPWWDSVAKQGVLGFDTRPRHVVIPELNNIRRMELIHQALERHRFSAGQIEKIMGGNWIRVLKTTLG